MSPEPPGVHQDLQHLVTPPTPPCPYRHPTFLCRTHSPPSSPGSPETTRRTRGPYPFLVQEKDEEAKEEGAQGAQEEQGWEALPPMPVGVPPLLQLSTEESLLLAMRWH